MKQAGFIKVALWVFFQSGPKVAADEQLEEESQNNKVHLIHNSLQQYHKYL